MNFLRRVFNGRVAKPRQLGRDQQQGNDAPASSRRPDQHLAIDSSSRAASGILAPAPARSRSPQRHPSPSKAASFPGVRIKQEDEEDGTFEMPPPEYDHPGFATGPAQMDGVADDMAMGGGCFAIVSLGTPFEEDPSDDGRSLVKKPSEGANTGLIDEYDSDDEDGSFAGDSTEGAHGEDTDSESEKLQSDEESVSEEELTAILIDSIDMDEALPSIEVNDCEDYNGEQNDAQEDVGKYGSDEDDEQDSTGDEDVGNEDKGDEDEGDEEQVDDGEEYVPRAKTPIYLHGMAHRLNRDAGTDSEGDVNTEDILVEDEDFEEELRGEMEEGLLIEDSDLRCWLHHKRATASIETWTTEACRLYKLLFLRGLYPVFRFGWIWGLTEDPVPRGLFGPQGSDDKCLLKYSRTLGQGQAERAIRDLFKMHVRVGGLLNHSTPANAIYRIRCISPIIKREIERYARWAERDMGFWHKRDYVSPVFVIAYKTPEETSRRRPIVEKCQTLVDKYRNGYAARGIENYPRCIYIFVVVQHIVLVMVADTDGGAAEEPYPLAELDISQRSHWLDYSLAISTTILMARDALLAHKSSFPEIEWESDDPDA